MRNPKVIFQPETFVDIILAAVICDIEISGLAKVEREGDFYIVHGNVEIFDQTCSVKGTHLDPRSFGSWIQEVRSREIGQKAEISEIPLFRMWWHSHVFGQSRPSLTDRKTMDKVWGPVYGWQIMMIVNKFHSVYLELDTFESGATEESIIRTFGFTRKFTPDDYEKMLRDRRSGINRLVRTRVTREAGEDNRP